MSWLRRRIRRVVPGPVLDTLRRLRHVTRLDSAEYTPERQWARVIMRQEIERFLRSMGPRDLSSVEVSGRGYESLPWKTYHALEYPAFDLCAPPPIDQRYDVVLCDQVLEHVIDPWRAVRTLFELCRPGGYVVVDTPFLVRVHEYPSDYWRFSREGLRMLLETSGFEVVEVHSWGNRACVKANFNRWAAYRPWSSLRNEANFPVVVWAYARRPPGMP